MGRWIRYGRRLRSLVQRLPVSSRSALILELVFTIYHVTSLNPVISEHVRIDVVKSKIQSGAGVYSGMVDCFSKTWKNQGLKGFTNGLIPTLVRSPFGTLHSMAAVEKTSL